MQRLLISLAALSVALSGCAGYNYNNTNCFGSKYAHCDSNKSIAVKSLDGKRYVIRDNLLFGKVDTQATETPLPKEDVLAFAFDNPEFVVMYDPKLDLATIHRRVHSYQESIGDAMLGGVLLVVGASAIPMVSKSHESCYEKHMAAYKAHQQSDRGQVKQNATEYKAMAKHELEQAFGCLR